MLLFTVALAGAALAGTGMVWHTAQMREKEKELLFAGNEFRNAIRAYYLATPSGLQRFPPTLEDLMKDPRFPTTVRHLRKLYRDPVTGGTDWGLVAAPGGGIMGVYSKSEATPRKRADFAPPNQVFAELSKKDEDKLTYQDWKFVFLPAGAAVPRSQSAPRR